MKSDKSSYLSILNQIKKDDSESSVNLNDRVLIVDGLNTFIRSFAVNPAVNEDGLHVGGLAGFLKSIKYSISLLKPTRCIIVFDGKDGSKRRRKIYPEYKQNRKVKERLNRNVDWGTAPQDEQQSMKHQISRLIEYLEQLPLNLICVDGVEADDVMAYISKQILKESKIILMSTDKDFLQLVDDRIKVWSPTKKKLYDKNSIFEEYGISSENFLLYRMMEGDKSDNISGIKGVGLKSIIKYLPMVQDSKRVLVKDVIDYVEKSDSKIKALTNIKSSRKLLDRNFHLMQLFDVDMGNHIKLKVQGAIDNLPQKMVKHEFQIMFMKDKLQSQILNLDSWLLEFMKLDRIRGLSTND